MSVVAKQHQRSLFEAGEAATGGKTPTIKGVTVREVTCKSLLNRSSISDYSFNCYTGCGHGCVYCYARFMQRFHPHDEPWGKFVDVKVNAAEVLARQLRRMAPGDVFTCSACDGWQRAERHYKLTRRCCQLLLDAGFHLNVLTKSKLVLRDLDVFTGRDVQLGVTITTPDERLAKLWEPAASSVADRVRVLREGKAAGLATIVMFGPLLPGISDTPEVLAELFALAADAGVDRIWTDAMNPRPRVWPAVQALVQRRFGGLLPLYRSVLFDKDYRADYLELLGKRIRRAAREAGVAGRLG